MRTMIALATALLATPAMADGHFGPAGDHLTPEQTVAVFEAGCMVDSPAQAPMAADRYRADFGFVSDTAVEGLVSITSQVTATRIVVEYGETWANCLMMLDTATYGDGYDLYVALEAVVLAAEPDPVVDVLDGGLRWSWTEGEASHTVEYSEAADSFLLFHEVRAP